MAFKKIDPKMNLSKTEEEILKFWNEDKIFEKSLEKRKKSPLYTFYDGPPFATGTPHYGHIVASTMKDVVPRYWTMKGRYVPRKWGWDCHGLPIENIVEKELGYKTKKEIEKLGVEKFNALCRSKVLEYVEEWKKVINRLGRWADMENSYKTMDLEFMESVWWVFKELYDKGYIYEGYRSMHVCPRCETTLSQSEVAEGYKTIKDLSAIAKFELEEDPGVYVLAWTTTPWTLIGNVALAVGEKMKYVEVRYNDKERYIFAKDLLDNIVPENDYNIISEFEGRDLVGKKYKPLFNYYSSDEKLKNRNNGWRIYSADFVTTQEGTGVVHIAPAFGEDDLNFGLQYNLPFIQHVGMDGVIKKEAGEFAGMNVKPIEDHMKTDVEIIKYLAGKDLLFAKEKYEHSYPHCWRCETPLINYATSSWFVSITKFKERMIELAQDINWSPEHIKIGRFGNWLDSARDWSISRQRFWASVMPIWKCEKCKEIKVIGSTEKLNDLLGNFYILRHGEARNNIEGVFSSSINDGYYLTDKGIEEIEKVANELTPKNIDLIISSDFDRTKQTSEIISKKIGAEIIYDERLRETNFGDYINKKFNDVSGVIEEWDKGGDYRYPNGENREELNKRAESFYNDLFRKYSNKKVLIVAHGDILTSLQVLINGGDCQAELKKRLGKNYIKKGKLIEMKYKVIDLHKDIVDKITFSCGKCDAKMKRIPDVLDTWFDSGSMPYAQLHYPFENEEQFKKGFPAEFIAEGIDQTRAWFYYLHAIASAIKDSRAFSNVVVNGIVLAEDGKKMAKRLQNYPDPMYVMEKYGSDVLRYYLLTSPVMQAENLNFKESELAELYRGMFRMLWNSYSFFVLYANIDKFKPLDKKLETKNLLDRWIVSELQILIKDVNSNMESYELTRAARLFPKFVDNLSNWYIRRSRRRFWKSESDEDKKQAYETLHYVLVTLSKLMAPFTPFIAEEIYKNLTGGESVHLEKFPEADDKLVDEKLNQNMSGLREIITLGLQERAKNKIKVRQPLAKVILGQKYTKVFDELISKTEWSSILSEELNVKGASLGTDIELVGLDTNITNDLKLEGVAREIIRHIQEMRKEAGYEVDNRISIGYSGWAEVFDNSELKNLVAKETLADGISSSLDNPDLEKKFSIEGNEITISIRK